MDKKCSYKGLDYATIMDVIKEEGLEPYKDRVYDSYNRLGDMNLVVPLIKGIIAFEKEYGKTINNQSLKKGYPLLIEDGSSAITTDIEMAKHFNYPIDTIRVLHKKFRKEDPKLFKDRPTSIVKKVYDYCKSNPRYAGQKRVRPTKDSFYPQEYNGVIFVSNIQVSHYSGHPMNIVEQRRQSGYPLSSIIETPPQIHKGREVKYDLDVYLPLISSKKPFADRVPEGTVSVKASEFYPQSYLGRMFYTDAAVSLYTGLAEQTVTFRRASLWTLRQIIETEVQNTVEVYPYTYEGVLLKSDRDTSAYILTNKGYELSSVNIRGRRGRGWSIPDIIEIPLVGLGATKEYKELRKKLIEDYLPFKMFGVQFDSIDKLRSYTGSSKSTLMGIMKEGLEELRLFRNVAPILPEARTYSISSSPFKLLGMVWYMSLEDCCTRLRISYSSAKIQRANNLSEDMSVAKVYVRDRIQNFSGEVTPDLQIVTREYSYGDNIYYECTLEGTTVYMCETEILESRLHYIVINSARAYFSNNGVFKGIVEACEFYNISRSSYFSSKHKDTPYKDVILYLADIMPRRLGELQGILDSGSFIVFDKDWGSKEDFQKKFNLNSLKFNSILNSVMNGDYYTLSDGMLHYYEILGTVKNLKITDTLTICEKNSSNQVDEYLTFQCLDDGFRKVYSSKELMLRKVKYVTEEVIV